MKTSIGVLLLATGFLTTFMAGAADVENSSAQAQALVQQRGTMAKAHETMAQCMRSDRTIEDCQKEMKMICKEAMGNEGCKMNGSKMGARRARMTNGQGVQKYK